MAQTIRFTYEAGLSPLSFDLHQLDGTHIGSYTPIEGASGEYSFSVADSVSGDPLVGYLTVSGVVESSDYVWVPGENGSVSIVGLKDIDLEPVLSAITDLEPVVFPDSSTVERFVDEETPIRFQFPSSGVTVSGQRTINFGVTEDVDGAITEESTGMPGNWYKLAYHENDRPPSHGTVVYKFMNGGVNEEVYVVLNVEERLEVISGPNTFTGTFQHSGIPIQGVTVKLSSSLESQTKVTNPSGQVVYSVPSNSVWDINAYKTGYSFTPTSLNVGETDVNNTYNLSSYLIPTPTDPALCNVLFPFLTPSGTPASGITVKATLRNRNSVANSQIVDNSSVEKTTDADGEVYLELIRQDQFEAGDGVYDIVAYDQDPERHIMRLATAIPNQNVYNFSQIMVV